MWGKPPERRSVVAELGQIRLGNAPSISQLGASLHGKGVSRVGRCDALDQTTSASSVKIAASHVSDRSRVDIKAELVVTAAVLHKPTVVPRAHCPLVSLFDIAAQRPSDCLGECLTACSCHCESGGP